MLKREIFAGVVLFIITAVLLTGCGGSFNGDGKLNTGPASGVRINLPAANIEGPTAAERKNKLANSQPTALTSPAIASVNQKTGEYKIGPQDVLEISVFKVPELSKTVEVASTGTVNMPLLGEVPVAGLTARNFERFLTKQLGAKYLQNPQVTVFVKDYNSQKVTIEGSVKKPGVYPLRGRTTLLQSIAIAQGLTDDSDEVIVLFRNVKGKRQPRKYSAKSIRSGQANDPVLVSGDVIIIGHSAIKRGWKRLMEGLPLARFLLFL